MAPAFIQVGAACLTGVPVVLATVHQPGRPYGKRYIYCYARLAGLVQNLFVFRSRLSYLGLVAVRYLIKNLQ
jgi:hypothetical protein